MSIHAHVTTAALPVRVKAAYGAGSLAESIKAFSFGLFVLFFYTTVLGVPGTLVGIATALGLAWDSVIDPWVGHWSDRSRSRFGRRHTFMFVGAVCMGVSFAAIFNPPTSLPTLGLFAWLFVTSVCLRTMTSIFMVPYYALGAELSADYQERTTVSAWRAGFALAGTVAAALCSFLVFFAPDATGGDPKFARDGYSAMGIGFGATITTAGLIATLGTRRHVSLPVVDGAAARGPFFASLRAAFGDATFRRLVMSASLFFLASVVNVSLALHYLTYYARIPGSAAIAVFQLAFYIGALGGVLIWLRVARVVQKHHLFVGTTLATALFVTLAYLLVGEGRLFGTGALVPLAIGNAMAGFFAGALWVLTPSMIADVAGQDGPEGKRRDGVFFGIYSFGQQAAAGVALLLTGVALDHIAGFTPGAAQQTAATVERIAMLYSVLPAALLGIAALVMLRYDLTRNRVERQQLEQLTFS